MSLIVILIVIVATVLIIYKSRPSVPKQPEQSSQPMHFDLLDENGDPIRQQDKPQELQYFCVNDKGYHVSVWPKNHDQFDIVEFTIAGMSHRDGIEEYLGEFVGVLQSEPTNEYDSNTIKVLAGDGHHVGYVPKNMTKEIMDNSQLPCPCFCYIGTNNGTYFSDCYILRN